MKLALIILGSLGGFSLICYWLRNAPVLGDIICAVFELIAEILSNISFD